MNHAFHIYNFNNEMEGEGVLKIIKSKLQGNCSAKHSCAVFHFPTYNVSETFDLHKKTVFEHLCKGNYF